MLGGRWGVYFGLLFLCSAVRAQELSFRDSVKLYNSERLLLNARGAKVLTAWGGANLAAGAIGYFAAQSDEAKYFHQMNTMWGAVDGGIALLGQLAVRRQLRQPLKIAAAYERYKRDKRAYAINAGLDLLYMGAGTLLLNNSASQQGDTRAMNAGYGKSLLLQGFALLVFDNVMLWQHRRNTDRWDTIMDEIRITGSSLSCTWHIGQRRVNAPCDTRQHY